MIHKVIMLILLVACCLPLRSHGKSPTKIITTKQELDDIHKEVVNRFAAVSSQNAEMFPLLDKLDRIHATTSDFFTRESAINEQVMHKDAKIRSLQQDLEALQRATQENTKKQTDQIEQLQITVKQHEQTIKSLETTLEDVRKQLSEAQAAAATQPAPVAVDQQVGDKKDPADIKALEGGAVA